jgi:hypothetical protein
MKSSKAYTNETFTKRVDHEGGERRQQKLVEPAICEKCGAIYKNRHWTAKSGIPMPERLEIRAKAAATICPACKQIANHIVGGYTSLSGAFFQKHRAEIEHLVKNEAKKALEDNPLSKIVKWVDDVDGEVTVETTTEHLAQRLGHAVKKAYDGDVTYDFSHENKVARVHWHRD